MAADREFWCFASLLQFCVAATLYHVVGSAPIGYSWGDGAILELYTIYARVGDSQLGPYSRFGWHHPGPMLFYMLAPVHSAFGSHAYALNAAAVLINVVSLLTIASVTIRLAHPLLCVTIMIVAAVYWVRQAISQSAIGIHTLLSYRWLRSPCCRQHY